MEDAPDDQQGGPADRPATPRQRFAVRAALVSLAGLAIGVGVYVLAVYEPTDASFYPKCASYRVAGIHCPGCGTTRALHSLFNGRLLQSLAYNPLTVLVLPYVLFAAVRTGWFYLRGQRARSLIWPPKLMWSFVALVVVYWVLRNVPVYPFVLLAPHPIIP